MVKIKGCVHHQSFWCLFWLLSFGAFAIWHIVSHSQHAIEITDIIDPRIEQANSFDDEELMKTQQHQFSKIYSIGKSLHIVDNACLTQEGIYILYNPNLHTTNTKKSMNVSNIPDGIEIYFNVHKALPIHSDANVFDYMNVFGISTNVNIEFHNKKDVIPYVTHVTQFSNLYHFVFSVYCGYMGLQLASQFDTDIKMDPNLIQLIYTGGYAVRPHSLLYESMHGIMSNFSKFQALFLQKEFVKTLQFVSVNNTNTINSSQCYEKAVIGRLSHWNLTYENITYVNNVLLNYLLQKQLFKTQNILLSRSSMEYLSKIKSNTINILLIQRNYQSGRHIVNMNDIKQQFESVCNSQFADVSMMSTVSTNINHKKLVEYLRMRPNSMNNKQIKSFIDQLRNQIVQMYKYQSKNWRVRINNYNNHSNMTTAMQMECNIIIKNFEDSSLFDQFLSVYLTDILVGAHGAGLSWHFAMPESSVLIELLPSNANHGCFPTTDISVCYTQFLKILNISNNSQAITQAKTKFFDTRNFLSLQRSWTIFTETAHLRGNNHLCWISESEVIDPKVFWSWKWAPFKVEPLSTSINTLFITAINRLGTKTRPNDPAFCRGESCRNYLMYQNLCKKPSNFY